MFAIAKYADSVYIGDLGPDEVIFSPEESIHNTYTGLQLGIHPSYPTREAAKHDLQRAITANPCVGYAIVRIGPVPDDDTPANDTASNT